MERREFEREVPIDDRDNEDVDYDGGERWSNSKLCRVNPRCLICCGKIVVLFIYYFLKKCDFVNHSLNASYRPVTEAAHANNIIVNRVAHSRR